jgi:ribonuclease HII
MPYYTITELAVSISRIRSEAGIIITMECDQVKICGIDEAGRGALAGPIFAAAVILTNADTIKIRGLNLPLRDSKTLSPAQRQRIVGVIRKLKIPYSVERCSAARINHDGIQFANIQIIRNLIRKTEASVYIVDGNFKLGRTGQNSDKIRCIPHADGMVIPVMLAAITAKVLRDEYMARLNHRFPVYGWEQNAGYGTSKHIESIVANGSTRQHRQVFVATALSNYRSKSFGGMRFGKT